MKSYKTSNLGRDITELYKALKAKNVGELYDLIKILNDEIAKEKVKIKFTETAWYKMQALIKECDKEIAWNGTVTRSKDDPKEFLIEDILVFKQYVTGVNIDTDDEEFAKYLQTLDDDTFNKRRFHGHSHVNMGVTPSGTDMNHRKNEMTYISDFFIYLIFNKSGAWSGAVYDVENNAEYETKDIQIISPTNEYNDWAKEEIKEKIKPMADLRPQTVNKPATVPASSLADYYSKNGKEEKKTSTANYYSAYREEWPYVTNTEKNKGSEDRDKRLKEIGVIVTSAKSTEKSTGKRYGYGNV